MSARPAMMIMIMMMIKILLSIVVVLTNFDAEQNICFFVHAKSAAAAAVGAEQGETKNKIGTNDDERRQSISSSASASSLRDIVPKEMNEMFVEKMKRTRKFQMVVLVYAPWCGHCKIFETELREALRVVRYEGIGDDVIDIVQMNGDIRTYPREGDENMKSLDQRKKFVKKFEVSSFPTVLLLERNDNSVVDNGGGEEQEFDVNALVGASVLAKRYKGSRDRLSLANYLRRVSSPDVRMFLREFAGSQHARDYANLRATEANAAFFFVSSSNQKVKEDLYLNKVRMNFNEEASKIENLQAWFGAFESDKSEEDSAVKEFFHALNADLTNNDDFFKRTTNTEKSYAVILAVHPRVPGDGDGKEDLNKKLFTTEYMICFKDDDDDDVKNECNVPNFVRTRIVAPLANLDQSVFNNILEFNSPVVFLVEGGGKVKIEAFAKNAFALAMKHRNTLAFSRVDGDELGPWIDKELAFGPIEFPICLGYHKKTHRSWYDRKWRARALTTELAIATFVDANFIKKERLPNFLPSMPIIGKIRSCWIRFMFRFSKTSHVQKLATFWWLWIFAFISFVSIFSFAFKYNKKNSKNTIEQSRFRSMNNNNNKEEEEEEEETPTDSSSYVEKETKKVK